MDTWDCGELEGLIGTCCCCGRACGRCCRGVLTIGAGNDLCPLRNSSSIRHMPVTNAVLSREPVWEGSHSVHISRSFSFPSLDQPHITLTTHPGNRSSDAIGFQISTSSSSSFLAASSLPITKSIDNPLHPAAWRVFLAASGLSNAGFSPSPSVMRSFSPSFFLARCRCCFARLD